MLLFCCCRCYYTYGMETNEQRLLLPKFLMLKIRTSPLAVTAMLEILGGPV